MWFQGIELRPMDRSHRKNDSSIQGIVYSESCLRIESKIINFRLLEACGH